jgi:hypothetical protein
MMIKNVLIISVIYSSNLLSESHYLCYFSSGKWDELWLQEELFLESGMEVSEGRYFASMPYWAPSWSYPRILYHDKKNHVLTLKENEYQFDSDVAVPYEKKFTLYSNFHYSVVDKLKIRVERLERWYNFDENKEETVVKYDMGECESFKFLLKDK